MKDLKALREEINALDQQLLTLLNDRARIAIEVGQVKAKINDPHIYNPAREQEVLSRVLSQNTGPLSNQQLSNIFKSVISSCRALECHMKIAYLGPEESVSHEALLKHFGLEVEAIPAKTISESIDLLEQGHVAFAVVPIENANQGSGQETADRLVHASVKKISEIYLPSRHADAHPIQLIVLGK